MEDYKKIADEYYNAYRKLKESAKEKIFELLKLKQSVAFDLDFINNDENDLHPISVSIDTWDDDMQLALVYGVRIGKSGDLVVDTELGMVYFDELNAEHAYDVCSLLDAYITEAENKIRFFLQNPKK